jgi:hypothetical protein
MRARHQYASLSLALLLLISPALGGAHDLDVPKAVMADPDGFFTYDWVLTVGPGTLFLAAYGWNGIENVSGGLVVDCFCDPEFCILEEGTVIHDVVFGSLNEPELPGSVENWFSGCAPLRGGNIVITQILPFDPVSAEPIAHPGSIDLVATPTPFRGALQLNVQLEENADIVIEILDVTGRRVRSVFAGPLPAGASSFSWDGRGEGAKSWPSGVYFVRLTTDEGVDLVRKVTRVR